MLQDCTFFHPRLRKGTKIYGLGFARTDSASSQTVSNSHRNQSTSAPVTRLGGLEHLHITDAVQFQKVARHRQFKSPWDLAGTLEPEPFGIP